MQINESTFLVTGGSSGIGKATAKLLREKGAKVAITGRDPQKLRAVANELGAVAIEADVANDADIDRTFELVLGSFDRLDGLINNAGIGNFGPVDELTREQFLEVYQINVFGAAMMGARAAKLFKEQRSGNIVNVASTAALKGFANGSVYSSSKFALRGLTQCWQAELRPYNVRVMEVNPSEVPTAFAQADRSERPEQANKLTSHEIAHSIVSALELDDRGFVPEWSVWATNPFDPKP